MSVTLPHEMADMVRAKVTSGEYASESEVIRDGLRALAARERAVESWLRDQVAPAYDRLQTDPDRALTADAVRARLGIVRER
ncbi:MAG: type II toxin-antitoxin system ParD family antitoxin [Phycicoccus sp.]